MVGIILGKGAVHQRVGGVIGEVAVLCSNQMTALHASLIIIEWLHSESRNFRHCLQGADAVPEDVDCVVVLLGMQREVDSSNW